MYEEPEALTGVFPQTAPNPENGKAIYEEKCLACHGDEGLGNGPDSTSLPNAVARIGAADVAALSSPAEWYTITYNGNIDRFMPPFSGSLSEQDVWDVLSYVYTFSSPAERVAAGEQLFADTCTECHGADGSGAVPGAADLTDGEHMVTLSLGDIAQKVSTGNGDQEHVFSTVLDTEQIDAVALYVRSLVFPLEGQAVETVEEPTPAPTDAEDTGDAGEATAVPTDETGEDETDTSGDEVIEGTATVSGTVTSGSGGELPDGLEVTVQVYDHFEPVYEIVVPVEADGSYKVSNVPVAPEQIVISVIDYAGLFFPSEFYIVEEGVSDIDMPVTLYEVTNDGSQLAVARLHVFFQFTGEGTVQVIHQVSISNRGTEMVAPERDIEPILNFNVPEDATNLIFQEGTIGDPYVQTSTGFGDPTPIIPGESVYEVLFAYELPYEKSLEWSLPTDLDTDVAVFFVEGEEKKVESEQLSPSGAETLDASTFQVFVANNLPAGELITLDISGRATSLFSSSGNTLSIVIGAAGLLLAGFGVWRFFWADRKDAGVDLDAADSETLMDEIIALDEAFEAGELDEEDYLAQREALKEALNDALAEEETA